MQAIVALKKTHLPLRNGQKRNVLCAQYDESCLSSPPLSLAQ